MTIRTPKPFYFENGVIEFIVKNKDIFYSVSIWNKSGDNTGIIKSGKYNGEKPESLITNLINCDASLEALV